MNARKALVALTAGLTLVGGVASAATSPRPTDVTDLTLNISSATLIVEGLTSANGVVVSGSDPALQGKPVRVLGTISRDQKTLSVAPSGFLFPELPVPEGKVKVKDVSVDVIQMRQAVGRIDPASGSITMPMSLAIQLKSPSLGLKCLIRGFDLSFGTGSVTVGTEASAPKLQGAVLDKRTNALTLVGAAKIPDASKIAPADCDVISRLIASGLSGKSLGLSISGTSVTGSSYRTPAAATLSASRLAFANKRATVTVNCSGAGPTNRSCSGTLSLTVNTATPFTLVGNWAAAAGRPATVAFALTDSQRSAIRNNKVLGRPVTPTGKLVATVDNGTGATKSLSGVTSN